jgi:hypothetical protein
MKNEKEIKLEALQLAHNDEMLKFVETLTMFKENFASSDEESFVRYEDFLNENVLNNIFPKTENIIQRAKEYYNFINNFC